MADVTTWDFTGKTALVTGATRGIGLAIAELFVRSGGNVAITARKADELDLAARSLGERALAVQGGADHPGHAKAAVAAVIERFGRLDILVNNAATNPQYGPLHEADMSAVDKVWSVNQRAPLVFVQEAWTQSMKAQGGVVLNVCSVGGIRVSPHLGAYHTSKAALIYMTQQLSLEMAPTVRVNGLAPAVVRTKMASVLWEGAADPTTDYPLRRLGEPEDIAEAAAFLCSDSASWITGEIVVLDGGIRHRLAGS